MLLGRDYILPDDVLYMAPLVINHRLLVKPEARLRKATAAGILNEIIQTVPVPQA